MLTGLQALSELIQQYDINKKTAVAVNVADEHKTYDFDQITLANFDVMQKEEVDIKQFALCKKRMLESFYQCCNFYTFNILGITKC